MKTGILIFALALAIGAAGILAGGPLFGASPASPVKTPPPGAGAAVVIDLSGKVDDYSRDGLRRRFAEAQALGARTIILRINTYGGLATAGLDISRFIKSRHNLHTIAYVDTKAISAGAMIALACDEIVMAPSATLGDCAPISISANGRLVPLPPAERAKLESPILADFHDSAVRNGHNPLLAAAMVSVSNEVYWVQNSAGDRRVVGSGEYKTLAASGDWHPVDPNRNPFDSDKTLLTVHTDDAVRIGLASGTAESAQALAQARGLSIVETLSPGVGEGLVEILGSAGARMILLVVFLMSLYLALHIPGKGAAEAICVISLGTLLGVPLLTGYAQWWEITAVLVGLALLAFEIFVFPGHFVSAIAGLALIFFGFIMTFAGREPGGGPGILPRLDGTWAALQTGMLVVVGALACSLLLSAWLRRYLPKIPYFSHLILTATSGAPLPADSANLAKNDRSDTWPFVGSTGRAVSDLRPSGIAEFPFARDRRKIAVISESGFIRSGTPLTVREIRGNQIVVRGEA